MRQRDEQLELKEKCEEGSRDSEWQSRKGPESSLVQQALLGHVSCLHPNKEACCHW